MPQFLPGESKIARVVMQNPTTKAFDYDGVILMGTGLAEVSRVSFHLNAGESKEISFPVVMPIGVGTYPVYVGVFSDGMNIALYRAVEDVVILGPPLEFLSLKFNGQTNPTISPRSSIVAELRVRASQAVSFNDAYIIFGKAYDIGTEPKAILCSGIQYDPDFWECTEKDLGYYYLDNIAFLPMPILGQYIWFMEQGWGLNIVYFNSSSELKGATTPWNYSSGHSTFAKYGLIFTLSVGELSLIFPRADRPEIFLQPCVSDTIVGTFDALVIIGSYRKVFKNAITVGVSTKNPNQLSLTAWISKVIQPTLLPIYSGE